MKKSKGFKQLTIDQMIAKRKSNEFDQLVSQKADEFAYYIDQQTELVIVELLQELGFKASMEMAPEEAEQLRKDMKKAGYSINVNTETVDSKFVVTIEVIQEARVLEFELENNLSESVDK